MSHCDKQIPLFSPYEIAMHAYPNDLVRRLVEKWKKVTDEPITGTSLPTDLPPKKSLRHLISTCYQVSMMREEDRPIVVRLILVNAEYFSPSEGPPESFQRRVFSSPLPCNEYELRRLSPAVDFERSLIGIEHVDTSEFQIWGVINSGKRWLQLERGGSKKSNRLPSALVIQVTGPGMITICRGTIPIAVLNNGKFVTSAGNVFQSQWVKQIFSSSRDQLLEEHEKFREKSTVPVARIHGEFIENMHFQLLKRIISVTRISNHGGTFIIFPDGLPGSFFSENPPIQIKYAFADDEQGERQHHLFTRTIQTATVALGNAHDPDQYITWNDYVALSHEETFDLEEAFYEQAQFVASLGAVDGAVVVTKNGAIGFGGMIVGPLNKLTAVAMANDMEGDQVTLEAIEGSGSRHRSAYHLCNQIHQAMAIVVSQDGGVQVIKWKSGIVTCWDLTSTSLMIRT